MSRTGIRAGRAVMLVCAVLLAASSAHAQSSALGHAAARATYPTNIYTGAPAFRIYPGDKGFQATMKIEHFYQDAERFAGGLTSPQPSWRSPSPRPTAAAAPMEVSVTVPEAPTEMVTLRGPDGVARSFPIVGGRAAIKTRTIIVRPGEQLRLMIRGGRVEVLKN